MTVTSLANNFLWSCRRCYLVGKTGEIPGNL